MFAIQKDFFGYTAHLWHLCSEIVTITRFKYIFIRFGSKLYRQIVGIPMDTNCAPLVADLFLFCYGRDFMLSPDIKMTYLILIILILNKW